MPDTSLRALWRGAWRGRDLALALAARDIRVRYAEASMGVLWALFTPLLTVAAGVAFDALARARGMSSEGRLTGVMVTSVPWAFVTGAIAAATTCVSANAAIVSKVAFPRVVLPVAAVLAQLPDAVIAGAGLGAGLVLLGVPVAIGWWWVLPSLGVLVIWTMTLALALA
ncbi:MAG: ABC transporter permease, partial [Gemmatimonadaceae bacterium]|nr:ABC transporter permease [Gemmatimonadaceae bacterium]